MLDVGSFPGNGKYLFGNSCHTFSCILYIIELKKITLSYALIAVILEEVQYLQKEKNCWRTTTAEIISVFKHTVFLNLRYIYCVVIFNENASSRDCDNSTLVVDAK